jgi:hypothetical protein
MDSSVKNFGRAGVSIKASFDWYVEIDCDEAAILPFASMDMLEWLDGPEEKPKGWVAMLSLRELAMCVPLGEAKLLSPRCAGADEPGNPV